MKLMEQVLETILAIGGHTDAEDMHSYAECMGYGSGTVEQWDECIKLAAAEGLLERREVDANDLLTGKPLRVMAWGLTKRGREVYDGF